MASLYLLFIAPLVVSASGQLEMGGSKKDFLDVVAQQIRKDVSTANQPLAEALTQTIFSQCLQVKKSLGVSYVQIKREAQPDLNKLTLEFDHNNIRTVYNITTAAEEIPLSQNYNPRQKLIIYVHGWNDNPTHISFQTVNDAFRQIGEFDVLALDGSSLIRWLYLLSSSYVRFIGQRLAEVLAAMVKSGLDPSDIHMIGHSLGAHICSFTGKTFTKLTGQEIGRISGLDPAGPCFANLHPELRLKATDAAFVDVIHTDSGVYGLKDPVGDVDFYPNGGHGQPNCLNQACSHTRAWVLYAESVVKPKAFPALRCRDWNAFKNKRCDNIIGYMGYPCERGTKGLFFLQTRGESPYGLGREGLTYRNNNDLVKQIESRALDGEEVFG